MLERPPQPWLLVGLLAFNALFAYLVHRLGSRGADRRRGEASVDPEAGTVECPACGTDNELGYRYCRDCLAELPGSMSFLRGGDGPLGRLTR